MARGSVRRRGQTWTVVVDVGRDPATRKRKQQTKGGFRTKGDATRWLTEQLGRLDQGTYVKPTKQTVGEYLVDWLAAVRAAKSDSTWERYERNARRHLVPKLGHLPLQQLGPDHLSRAYNELHGAGLSQRTVKALHVIMVMALNDAVAQGKLTRNVATLKLTRDRLPKDVGLGHEMTTWTADQLRAFLDGLKDDHLYVPILLGATTGMRRGEVLGLRWSDVDLETGRLSVRQTLAAVRDPDTGAHVARFGKPKTKKGERKLKLDAHTVAALKAHRKAQNELRLMGAKNPHNLVFIDDEHGSPIHPEHFLGRFQRRVRYSGLPMIRFHDLRHTYATLALRAGVPVQVVSDRLGHANIGITLDTYRHAVPAEDEHAAETVAAAIFGA